ncbi:MAG TPA: NPCBM/NEW2 domain-containing protein [Pirellulales bacterium]|nr:NPCBM/NEW2 domain-containing protein [Pirellulales bacterium]
MNCTVRRLTAAFLACVASAVSAGEPELVPRRLVPFQGQPVAEKLLTVSAEDEVSFVGGRRLKLDELVAWGAPAEPRAKIQLLLADGGLLPLEDDMMPVTEDDRLAAFSDTFGSVKLPLKRVAGVMLHSPIDPQQRDELASRILTPSTGEAAERQTENRDRLLLENGDELKGRLVGFTENGVAFEAEVGHLSVERERIVAVAFDPSLRGAPAAARRTLVGFADGSLVSATSIKFADGQAEMALGEGTLLSAVDAEPVFLQPLVGKVTYLSDMPPAGYRHVPYLATSWDYRLDANVRGTRLRAEGHLFAKGVGMHSASRLTWQLDKPYRRFEAELAIDDETENGGSVVFRIFSGSREIYKSAVVHGGDKPLPVSIDIRDTRQLSLVVDYADRADVLDHADWLNARLVP